MIKAYYRPNGKYKLTRLCREFISGKLLGILNFRLFHLWIDLWKRLLGRPNVFLLPLKSGISNWNRNKWILFLRLPIGLNPYSPFVFSQVCNFFNFQEFKVSKPSMFSASIEFWWNFITFKAWIEGKFESQILTVIIDGHLVEGEIFRILWCSGSRFSFIVLYFKLSKSEKCQSELYCRITLEFLV